MRRPRKIRDDEFLTQFGTRDREWRVRPREGHEIDVSLLLGRLSPDEAAAAVRARPAANSGVHVSRCTKAGILRACGFTVLHTPGRKNGLHVSATCDGEWDGEAFDGCFAEFKKTPVPAEVVDDQEESVES